MDNFFNSEQIIFGCTFFLFNIRFTNNQCYKYTGVSYAYFMLNILYAKPLNLQDFVLQCFFEIFYILVDSGKLF